MAMGMPGEDPGWGKPHEILLGVLIPGLGRRRMARSGPASFLAQTRTLWLTFLAGVLLVGVVVLFLAGAAQPQSLNGTATSIVVLAIGVVLVTASWKVGGNPLFTSESQLLGFYRSRFFLRIALSEAAALLGFVAFFLCGNPAPYFVGLVPAVYGFLRVAPTVANLRQEQDELVAHGCPYRLYDLMLRGGSPPPSPSSPSGA